MNKALRIWQMAMLAPLAKLVLRLPHFFPAFALLYGGGPARYEIDRDSGTQVVESGLGSSGSGFIVLEALDSPNTTSQITYKVRYKNTGGSSGHNTYWQGGNAYRYMFVAVEILAG